MMFVIQNQDRKNTRSDNYSQNSQKQPNPFLSVLFFEYTDIFCVIYIYWSQDTQHMQRLRYAKYATLINI